VNSPAPGREHLAVPDDDETLAHFAIYPFCATQQLAQGTANVNAYINLIWAHGVMARSPTANTTILL
jgi:hypothetical protein